MLGEYLEINRNSIVCDASSLISLAEACLLDTLAFLKPRMKGSFIYPTTVRYESIEHPLGMKEHSLRALRLLDYEKNGIITFVDYDVSGLMKDIMNLSNSVFRFKGKPVKLIDPGEAAQIALAVELGIKNVLIDERSMRTLIEAPLKLKEHLEQEFKRPVNIEERVLDRLSEIVGDIHIIRSAEIAVIAYKYGYFDVYGEHKDKALQSALYTLKFSGCSISFEEIQELMGEINAGKFE
ncbi:MAG: hypothetical protein ACP5H8_01030 [Candidatus Micrarchaeia archaeon]